MSNIYVKWKNMDRAASNISNYEKWMRSYSARVENVRNTLQLSPNVSASVKAKLTKDIEKINELLNGLNDCSQKLKEISEIYKNTEISMLEN